MAQESEPHAEKSAIWEAFVDITSGTMGGVAQVLAGHPLDTVKVRLQSQVTQAGQAPQFSGTIDCVRKTIAAEGIAGLYKGAWSPLAGAMALNAGIFFAYGQSKRWVSHFTGRPIEKMTLGDFFMAGASTGLFVAPIEGPVDLLKCKLQAQVGEGQYAGVLDCAKQLYKLRGIPGLFQGLWATIVRDVPSFGSYFFGFELTRRALTPKDEKPTLLTSVLAGGTAGFAFWGLFYPLDIVKTRIQIDATLPEHRKYKGVIDCIGKTWKEGGIAAFFKGYTPSLLRAIPLNAAIFFAVLSTKQLVFAE